MARGQDNVVRTSSCLVNRPEQQHCFSLYAYKSEVLKCLCLYPSSVISESVLYMKLGIFLEYPAVNYPHETVSDRAFPWNKTTTIKGIPTDVDWMVLMLMWLVNVNVLCKVVAASWCPQVATSYFNHWFRHSIKDQKEEKITCISRYILKTPTTEGSFFPFLSFYFQFHFIQFSEKW